MNDAKKFTDTYMYKISDYEKTIFESILKYDRIDKSSDQFSIIRLEIQKRASRNLFYKAIEREDIVLMYYVGKAMPAAFKVFTARDINDKVIKTFVDVTDIIKIATDGNYICLDMNKFLARIISAVENMAYYSDNLRIHNNGSLPALSASIFSKLFANIIDYIFKISVDTKMYVRVQFLAVKYFLMNQFGKGEPASHNAAMALYKLDNAEIAVIKVFEKDDSYDDINTFIELLSKVIKLPKLTTAIVIEKWLFKYGQGTHFALEYYPSFADMMINVYSNTYFNNQRAIEQLIGNDVKRFGTSIMDICDVEL